MCSDTFNGFTETSSKPDIQIKQISDNVEPTLTLEPSEQCAPILLMDLLKHQASKILKLNHSQIVLNQHYPDRPEQCAPILLIDLLKHQVSKIFRLNRLR